MGDACHQGIPHAEGPMSIRHTGVSPATRKHLQLIEFIWHCLLYTSPSSRRNLPFCSTTCFVRLAPRPPSPVKMVRLGLSKASGNATGPSEYVYSYPLRAVRCSFLPPLRYSHELKLSSMKNSDGTSPIETSLSPRTECLPLYTGVARQVNTSPSCITPASLNWDTFTPLPNV